MVILHVGANAKAGVVTRRQGKATIFVDLSKEWNGNCRLIESKGCHTDGMAEATVVGGKFENRKP